jgi:hypothetical protein
VQKVNKTPCDPFQKRIKGGFEIVNATGRVMAIVTVLGGNDPSQARVQFTTEAAARAAQEVVAALNAHIADEDQGYGFLDYTESATIPGGAIGSQGFLHGVLGDSVNGSATQWLRNAAIQVPGTSKVARFLSSPFDVVRITGDAPAAVISTGPQTVIAGNAGIHYFFAEVPRPILARQMCSLPAAAPTGCGAGRR